MKVFKKVLTVLLITCFLIPGFQGKAIVQASQSFNDVSLSGGYFHSVVSVNGEVWDWGANNLGQLGDGTATNSLSPLNATGIKNVKTAVSGFQYTLALTSSGDLYAWGQNAFGNLGDGTTDNSDSPVKVSVLSDVTAISTRSQTSIALSSDGKVYTWGNNDCGQLGNGQTGNNSNVNIPVQVQGITNAIAVAAGTNECYAVLSDGTVKSWGDNRYGQLGDGTTVSKTSPVMVSGLTNVIAISAGQNFVLALKSDHTVWAWGFNAFGQLGINSPVNAMTPVQVSGLTNVTQISAGSTHSMAIKSDGSLFTWGMNMFGQVGDGTNNMSFYAPKQIINSGVIEIGAGYNHSLALMDDGKMYAFGLNTYGALGDGTTTDNNIPVLSQLDLSKLTPTLSAPTCFDVTSKTATSITLSWDAVVGATEYEISVNNIVNSVGAVTSTTIIDLEPETLYEVRIRAINGSIISDWSNSVFATTDPINASGYTRGEWIQLLTQKLNLSLPIDEAYINYFFADSQESSNGLAIETAQMYGILPYPSLDEYDLKQEIPLFYPDDLATREFAAYTAVKAMGFIGEYTPECADAIELTYPSEVAVAITNSFIKLNGNLFMPEQYLSTDDLNDIFTAIDELNMKATVDPENTFTEVIYTENAIIDELMDITDYTIIENVDGTYFVNLPKTPSTMDLKEGDVFVLHSFEEASAAALKVKSIDESIDGINLICESPAFNEILEKLAYRGKGEAHLENFIPAEGVTFEYIEPVASTRASTGLPGTLKLDFEYGTPNSNRYLTGSIELKISDITADIDLEADWLNGINVNDFLISITTDTQISFGVTNQNDLIKKIDLGTIPIGLGPINGAIKLHFVPSIDGSATVAYSFISSNGLQYSNDAVRLINSCEKGEFTSLETEVNLRGGFDIELTLRALMAVDLIGVKLELGDCITAISKLQHTGIPAACIDLGSYLYGILGIADKTAVSIFLENVCKINLSWEFWDEDSSPLKNMFHIEDRRLVENCTRGLGSVGGIVRDAETNQPIPNSMVCIYRDQSLLRRVYSFNNGKIVLGENTLVPGSCIIEISAVGYNTYQNSIEILPNETINIEPFLWPLNKPTPTLTPTPTITPSPILTKTPSPTLTITPTPNEPYIIMNESDLNTINDNLSASYKLGSDIVVSNFDWSIGNYSAPFTGTFDGNGKKISGLPRALFHTVENAQLQNINIEFIGSASIAQSGLADTILGGTVSNCHVYGVGSVFYGGLAAVVKNKALISNCSSTIQIIGSDNTEQGGLIGRVENSTVIGCYATGNVTGGLNPGGLIGLPMNSEITDCYATGNVESTNVVLRPGALISVLTSSYNSNVSHCYSTGLTNGQYSHPFGLLYSISASNCYGIGSPRGDAAYDKYLCSSSELQLKSTFVDWDFDTVWAIDPNINNGYPYLRNNPPGVNY